jgi:hypothetical protein
VDKGIVVDSEMKTETPGSVAARVMVEVDGMLYGSGAHHWDRKRSPGLTRPAVGVFLPSQFAMD